MSTITRSHKPRLPVAQPKPVQLSNGESMAISDFARDRHVPDSGKSYYDGDIQDILSLVKENWASRKPGAGRDNLDEVVLVPVPPANFFTTTVPIRPDSKLRANFSRRRAHEEPYLSVMSEGKAMPANYAKVVVYSKETLAENSERSIDTDWEVVSLIASPVENEPMNPVTMMRNMKGKPGGSQVNYSAQELVDAIDFWSKHTKVRPPNPK